LTSSQYLQSLEPNKFVLKTYTTADAPDDYESELDAFRKLNTMDHGEILRFYGNFTHKRTYNIILEYADKGTLEDYFRDILPPSECHDIEKCWKALLAIMYALHTIHNVEVKVKKPNKTLRLPIAQGRIHVDTVNKGDISKRDSMILLGFVLCCIHWCEFADNRSWHQDVKPANILVFSNGKKSPYDWKFKLADFGLCRFKYSVKGSGGVTTASSHSTTTYGMSERRQPRIFHRAV